MNVIGLPYSSIAVNERDVRVEQRLVAVRGLVLAYVGRITESPDLYRRHEELVASHAELSARSLVKQRTHADATAGWLVEHGTEPATATLAAELGLACFYAGRTAAGNGPTTLGTCVEAAFTRLNQRGS